MSETKIIPKPTKEYFDMQVVSLEKEMNEKLKALNDVIAVLEFARRQRDLFFPG